MWLSNLKCACDLQTYIEKSLTKFYFLSFQGDFYSTAFKTLISVSTLVLLGLIIAYHSLEVQVSHPSTYKLFFIFTKTSGKKLIFFSSYIFLHFLHKYLDGIAKLDSVHKWNIEDKVQINEMIVFLPYIYKKGQTYQLP